MVLLRILIISPRVNGYKDQIFMPRYCEDTQGYVQRPLAMLEKRPTGNDSKYSHSYIAAAKLLFISFTTNNIQVNLFLTT